MSFVTSDCRRAAPSVRWPAAQASRSGYLSEVERGQKEASSEILASVAEALDVPISTIMREVGDRISVLEGITDLPRRRPRRPHGVRRRRAVAALTLRTPFGIACVGVNSSAPSPMSSALAVASLLSDLVLAAVGDRTAVQALRAGVPPREIWIALCVETDVPPSAGTAPAASSRVSERSCVVADVRGTGADTPRCRRTCVRATHRLLHRGVEDASVHSDEVARHAMSEPTRSVNDVERHHTPCRSIPTHLESRARQPTGDGTASRRRTSCHHPQTARRPSRSALAQIDRQFGKGSVMRLGSDERAPVEVIPTGSIALDVALGIGGLPRGRIVEIYGPESSGKTTLTLHAIANAQRSRRHRRVHRRRARARPRVREEARRRHRRAAGLAARHR